MINGTEKTGKLVKKGLFASTAFALRAKRGERERSGGKGTDQTEERDPYGW